MQLPLDTITKTIDSFLSVEARVRFRVRVRVRVRLCVLGAGRLWGHGLEVLRLQIELNSRLGLGLVVVVRFLRHSTFCSGDIQPVIVS